MAGTPASQFAKDMAAKLSLPREEQATSEPASPQAIAKDVFKKREERFGATKNFIKSVAQGAARQFAVEGQEVLSFLSGGRASRSVTPPDKGVALSVYKSLYGTDEPINLGTLQGEAKDVITSLGGSEKTGDKYKGALTGAFIGLDLIPGFGASTKSALKVTPKLLRELSTQAAKEGAPEVIAQLLKGAIRRVAPEKIDDVSRTLSAITDPKVAQKTLQEFIQREGGTALSFTKTEATKKLDDLAKQAVDFSVRQGDEGSDAALRIAQNVETLRAQAVRAGDDGVRLAGLVDEAETLVQALSKTARGSDDLIDQALRRAEDIRQGTTKELFALDDVGNVRVANDLIEEPARADELLKVADESTARLAAQPEQGINAPSLAEAVEQYLKAAGSKIPEDQIFKDIQTPGGTGFFTRDEIIDAASGGTERGFSKTIRESPRTSPELARKTAEFYNPITNKQSLEEAVQILGRGDDEALSYINNIPSPTATSVAVGELLIEKFQRAGRIDAALDVVTSMSRKATAQGQAIQILSLWNRLTPGGILKHAQKELRKIGKELDPKLANKLVEQSRKTRTMPDGWEKNFETAKMMKMIADEFPVDKMKKLALLHTMLLLLNPKTWMRNIIGNTGFQALENVTDVFAAGLDSALSLVTGIRTKVPPSILAQSRGALKGTIEGWREAMAGVNTMALKTQFDIPQTQVFKGKVGGAFEKLLTVSLRVPDRAFFQAAYDGSIYNQLKAANITARRKGLAPITEATEEMKEVAVYDGLYRTFQDDSLIATKLSEFKRGINSMTGSPEFGFGDAILKFPRTPGNLLARGLAYSPAGFFRTAFLAAQPLMGAKKFDQKKFVEAFSRASVGTSALFGTGFLLHKSGVLTGASEDTADVAGAKRIQGITPYQINASALKRLVLSGFDVDAAKMKKGDTLVNYDWFQPAALPIVMGANISAENGLTPGSFLGQLFSAVADGTDTLVEQPVLQGLKKFSENIGFYGLSGAVLRTLATMPASFVPTLLNQIRQLKDNQSRETFSRDVWESTKNSVKDRIPGLSETLPQRYSTFGDKVERYQDGSNNFLNVFFNPLFAREYKDDKAVSYILDLYGKTGDAGAVPDKKRLKQTVNGEEITMGPKQNAAFQKLAGELTRTYVSSLNNDPRFKAKTPEEQADYIASILRDIHATTKYVILGDRPKKLPTRVKKILIQQYGN